ncbi:hypothetical protein PbB2_03003 [Candidatus Phycosocius bacilliformis]|uniref:Uncharacterized protein n=1 Tax=Candidatus Phycosocius bacilliformis TaxID=1445552 RepID=A0A2P2EE21_9PROT|nr:DUF695 domain-containing protein [Candidatus Phycosocius bacilliformis]GBF59308.1 hypothetical protein PbB2_03003 [Candidatus Phycosocius bacilliformis]
MSLIEAIGIVTVAAGAVYFLGRHDFKAKAEADGWRYLRPGATHWFACVGCFLLVLLLGFMALTGAAFQSDPACACQKTTVDIVAFWLLFFGFSSGAAVMSRQIVQLYRRNIRWHGDLLCFSGPDGEVQRNIHAIAESRMRWNGEVEWTFYDKSTLRVDTYARGAAELLQHVQTIYAPNWFVYETKVDDQPALITVDLEIGDATRVRAHPCVTYITVALPDGEGKAQGQTATFDQLDELASALCFAIKSNGRLVLAGRSLTAGQETFYFYSKSKSDVSVLKDVMVKWPSFPYTSGTHLDPEWKIYKDFLYPTPEEMFSVTNRQQVEEMCKRGDREESVRDIEHFVTFEDPNNLNAFSLYLNTEGFQILQAESSTPENLSLNFKMPGALSEIDAITVRLFRAAKDLNGTYVGWRATIVK